MLLRSIERSNKMILWLGIALRLIGFLSPVAGAPFFSEKLPRDLRSSFRVSDNRWGKLRSRYYGPRLIDIFVFVQ